MEVAQGATRGRRTAQATTESIPANLRTSEQRVESVVRSLKIRLEDTVDAALIEAAVEAEFDTYSDARVSDFIPIFVERRVGTRPAQSQARSVEHRRD